MLNNYRFTSWCNIILVNVGDLIRLVFTLEASLKSRGNNFMGIRASFWAAIEAASLPGR